MTNYEKVLKLVDEGIAIKHSTFDKTGYIFIDLGGRDGEDTSHLKINM